MMMSSTNSSCNACHLYTYPSYLINKSISELYKATNLPQWVALNTQHDIPVTLVSSTANNKQVCLHLSAPS